LSGGDKDVGCVPPVHPVDERLEESVGSHRGGTRFHDFLHKEVSLSFDGRPAETTDDYPLAVDHGADVPSGGCDARADDSHGFVGAAGGNVRSGGVCDTLLVFAAAALGGETGGLPVGDASYVVIDPREPATFEPARGSW
jgi:hypothetical protein